MVKKELKSRSHLSVVDSKASTQKDNDVQNNVDNNVVKATSADFEPKSLDQLVKKLRERDLYYDTYADFMNSDSKDGAYLEHDEKTGVTTIYIKADTPQEAMDKLHDYGFISESQRDLYKSRFDELAAQGVDVTQIRGGDLSVLENDELFEEFTNMVLEAEASGNPIYVYDRTDVENRIKQRSLVSKDENSESVDGPDAHVSKSLSDQELLAKLADVELNAGLSGPDVQIGESHDLEMGD